MKLQLEIILYVPGSMRKERALETTWVGIHLVSKTEFGCLNCPYATS